MRQHQLGESFWLSYKHIMWQDQQELHAFWHRHHTLVQMDITSITHTYSICGAHAHQISGRNAINAQVWPNINWIALPNWLIGCQMKYSVWRVLSTKARQFCVVKIPSHFRWLVLVVLVAGLHAMDDNSVNDAWWMRREVRVSFEISYYRSRVSTTALHTRDEVDDSDADNIAS